MSTRKKNNKQVAAQEKKPKSGPKPETKCFYYKQTGHWKRNCPKYLADKKGKFSASSAYKFMIKSKTEREGWLHEEAGVSSNEREEKDWSKLWGINVSSKIKVFLWRLCWGT